MYTNITSDVQHYNRYNITEYIRYIVRYQSIQIKIRGKDKSEIRNAAGEFYKILVKASKKLHGSLERSYADICRVDDSGGKSW